MKSFMTLVTFLWVTTIVFAQHKIPTVVHNELLGDQIYQESFEPSPEMEVPSLRNVNGIIWVRDSSYSYNYPENEEELYSRTKVFTRDDFGNILIEMRHFWNENSQNWIKKDTITSSYTNTGMLQTILELPWNSALQQWADTSYCIELTEDVSQILTNIYRKWNYDANTFYGWGSKYYSIFNEEENCLYRFYYSWDSETQVWIVDGKEINIKDEDGKVVQRISQTLDTLTNTWKNSMQDLYTYNGNGRVTHYLQQYWDSETEIWINSSQTLYTYNVNGKLIQRRSKTWDALTNSWINLTQQLYTFDANENLIEQRNQTWDAETSIWKNNWLHIYIFDTNGNRIQDITQQWNEIDSIWVNHHQSLYVFNANNIISQSQTQSWDNDEGVWINSYQRLYAFDAIGNRIQELSQNWVDDEWVDNFKKQYFWSEFEAGFVNAYERDIRIYPNPSSDILRVVGVDNAKVWIYTLNGKLIKKENLRNEEIDVSDLKVGSYLIKLISDKQVIVKQILKK